MIITFKAESVSVEHRRNELDVTVDANGWDIAEQLDLDDRLHELTADDVVGEMDKDALLDAIGEDYAREYFGIESTDGTEG